MKNLIFIIPVLLLVILGCGNAPENKPVTNQPPIQITSQNLAKEYDENEIAADEKYKNKPLLVTGKITDISEIAGSIQVDLEGKKESGIDTLTVKCEFPENEKSKVSKLKKGSQATLSGIGDGKTANLYVGLTNCKTQ